METAEGATKLTSSLPEDAGETDFEFWTSVIHGGADPSKKMCVADEVFFQGQILPLWPYPYATSIDGSRRANISNSNSSSWSESSHSRRHSISANFYTHPSPKPHLPVSNIGISFPRKRKSTSSKSVGGSPWGLLQFGLAKTPALLQPKAGVGYINGSASKRHEENDCDGKKMNDQIKRSGLIGMLINKFRRKSSPGDYSARSMSSSSSSSSSSGSLRQVHRRSHSSRTFKRLDDYFQLNVSRSP